MKFSIRLLLGLVAFFAVGITALLNANEIWYRLLLTATILILTVGTLAAVGRTGPTRYFWVGFVVVGVAYMVAIFGFQTHTREHLVTNDALQFFHAKVQTTITGSHEEILEQYPNASDYTIIGRGGVTPAMGMGAGGIGMGRGMAGMQIGAMQFVYTSPERAPFMAIGHLLYTLLFAFLGGVVTRYFFVTRDTSAT